MRIQNHTPFPVLCFESRSVEDQPFDTVVARATLELAHGRVLRLSTRQEELVLADEFFGEPGTSSVRVESDLAPAKPQCDVVVIGAARPPGGGEAASWPVSVRVGELEKRLRVTGPRAWVRGEGGAFTLGEPEPAAEVPLRFELAFGGAARRGEREEICEQNPLGKGFSRDFALEGVDRVEAPQIEGLDDPVTALGREHAPEGVGVYGRAWLPRRERAGTFDDAWLASTWPRLPADFHFSYWNGAHPGLIVPGMLDGDEEIALTGFDPAGERRYRLPGHGVFLLLHLDEGEPVPVLMLLDTLIVDLERGKASLVYRAALGRQPPVRLAELRMHFQDPDETEATLGG